MPAASCRTGRDQFHRAHALRGQGPRERSAAMAASLSAVIDVTVLRLPGALRLLSRIAPEEG